MAENDGLPIPPHLAGEFYAWLWWRSEQDGAVFDLPEPVGRVDLWVDARLAFRNPDDTRVSAVMTGENPAATLEARAALAGGKVLQELRFGMRRDDREYFATLKGPAMHLQGLKIPQVVTEGGEEVLYERMHLYEEVCFVLAALFRAFGEERASAAWESDTVPALRAWIAGQ